VSHHHPNSTLVRPRRHSCLEETNGMYNIHILLLKPTLITHIMISYLTVCDLTCQSFLKNDGYLLHSGLDDTYRMQDMFSNR
jgi:hypothetical protein